MPLTPGRSIAVDKTSIPYGHPVWLDTTEPQSSTPLRRLVMAQDTGCAFVGAVRADHDRALRTKRGRPRVAAPGAARFAGRVLVNGKGIDLGRAVMVDEQLGPEGDGAALQQPVRHRRPGEAELADGGYVGRPEIGVGQQVGDLVEKFLTLTPTKLDLTTRTAINGSWFNLQATPRHLNKFMRNKVLPQTLAAALSAALTLVAVQAQPTWFGRSRT